MNAVGVLGGGYFINVLGLGGVSTAITASCVVRHFKKVVKLSILRGSHNLGLLNLDIQTDPPCWNSNAVDYRPTRTKIGAW